MGQTKHLHRSSLNSMGGMKVSMHIKEFEFILDEAKSLGGSNEGMNR